MSAMPLAIGTTAAVLLIAFTTASSPARAQTGAQPVDLDRITVVAPRMVHKRDRGRSAWVAEQKAYVRHGDLDLRRTADLLEMEVRVADAARQVCEELSGLYPDARPRTDVCIRRAIDDAMARVHQLAREQTAIAASDDE